MKLKNKKTGEIGWLYCDHISVPKKMTVFAEDKDLSANHWDYASLAELNEEWEDVAEPKEYWFINSCGAVEVRNEEEHPAVAGMHKQFGNYFETEREAEKTMEKLKAWKRLKDKGFSFEGYDDGYKHDYNSGHIEFYIKNDGDVLHDLDICFGGEE